MKVKKVCETCGSDEVMCDAWAMWDVDAQQWALASTFEYSHCEACEGECNIIEEEIADEP